MKKNNQKGITLIALVVSIIVMLILVVVSIQLIYDGGLIEKTREAAEKTSQEMQNEIKEANEAGNKIDEAVLGDAYLPPLEPIAMTKNEQGKYEVTVPGNLQWLSEQVNSGNLVPEGEETIEIILMNNIDYGKHLFTPIGKVTVTEEGLDLSAVFMGVFDGNGKTISRLYIDGIELGLQHVGLFGIALESEIKDITIANSTIKGNQLGSIVGATGFTTITNCHSIGNILEGQQVPEEDQAVLGGIAGILVGNCLVENCTNNSNIIQSDFLTYASGIAGWSFDQFSPGEGNSIINCSNSGTITGSFAAGIVSLWDYYESPTRTTDIIENCSNSGNISAPGGPAAGIAIMAVNPIDIVINCTNSGTITGNETADISLYTD